MFYANRLKREELCILSQKVFGKRWKWHYFVTERGYSIKAIEEQMLLLAKQIDEVLNANGKSGAGSGVIQNGSVVGTGQQTAKPKFKLDRKARRTIQRRRVKAGRSKAKSSVATARGSSRDSKGS